MRVRAPFETVGTDPTRRISIRPQDMSKIATLLIQKYSKPTTPIREVVINSLETMGDVVAAGGEFRPVEIDFSSYDDRNEDDISPFLIEGEDVGAPVGNITVTDYGEGMSRVFVDEVFMSLGRSPKDQDENAIGGFGIGSKSILSITDFAIWVTVKDGEQTTIVMSSDGDGFNSNIETVPTDAPNGTKVTVPVTAEVMSRIIDNISGDFLDYVSSSQVVVTGNLASSITVGRVVDNIVYTASNGVQVTAIDDNDGYRSRSTRVHTMVNGAPYPHVGNIKTIGSMIDLPNKGRANISIGEVVVNLDQNDRDVIILASREAIMESDSLSNRVDNLVSEAIEEMMDTIMSKIASSTDLNSLIENVNEARDSVPLRIVSIGYSGWGWIGGHRINRAMNLLSGNTDDHQDINFVDLRNGRMAPLSAVIDSDYSVINGCSSVSFNRAAEDRANGLDDWKKVANNSLRLTTTDNMASYLDKVDNLDELLGEDTTVGYLLSGDVGIDTIISDLLRYCAKNMGDKEPDSLVEKIMSDVNSRIMQPREDESINTVREIIKKKIMSSMKRKAPRRRTDEDKKAEAAYHIMTFDKVNGYQVTDFALTSPALKKFLDKRGSEWIAIEDSVMTDRSPYSRNRYSSNFNKSDIDKRSLEQDTLLANSVESKDLVIVVVRRVSMISRLADISYDCAGKYKAGVYQSRNFIEEAENRIKYENLIVNKGLSTDDIRHMIRCAKEMNAKNGLFDALVDRYGVNPDYMEIVNEIKGETEESSDGRHWGYSSHPAILFRNNMHHVARMFDKGEMMSNIRYIPPSVIDAMGRDVSDVNTLELIAIIDNTMKMIENISE